MSDDENFSPPTVYRLIIYSPGECNTAILSLIFEEIRQILIQYRTEISFDLIKAVETVTYQTTPVEQSVCWLLVVWGLWRINLCTLFNAKFCLYVYTFNERFLNEYLGNRFSIGRISFVCTRLTSFNSSYFFVQPCLSQEAQDVIYFYFFEQYG